jgi:hypothetical protein
VPEGSRLSPILFGIVVADLVRELSRLYPHACVVVNGSPQVGSSSTSTIWIGGFFYVDDLALCSTDPTELQDMIDLVQNWIEQSRLSVNADKSKIMSFHESQRQRDARQSSGPLHLIAAFPSAATHNLEEVATFEYLGLRLDSKLLMQDTVAYILEKADQGVGFFKPTTSSWPPPAPYDMTNIPITKTRPSPAPPLICSNYGNPMYCHSIPTTYGIYPSTLRLRNFKQH